MPTKRQAGKPAATPAENTDQPSEQASKSPESEFEEAFNTWRSDNAAKAPAPPPKARRVRTDIEIATLRGITRGVLSATRDMVRHQREKTADALATGRPLGTKKMRERAEKLTELMRDYASGYWGKHETLSLLEVAEVVRNDSRFFRHNGKPYTIDSMRKKLAHLRPIGKSRA